MTLLEQLEQYHKLGFKLIPTKDKHPFLKKWNQYAFSPQTLVDKFFSSNYTNGVGINLRLSRMVCVDVESDGFNSFDLLLKTIPESLPPTMICISQSGGFHILYNLPDNYNFNTLKLKMYKRIDFLNSQSILPLHNYNNRYWLSQSDFKKEFKFLYPILGNSISTIPTSILNYLKEIKIIETKDKVKTLKQQTPTISILGEPIKESAEIIRFNLNTDLNSVLFGTLPTESNTNNDCMYALVKGVRNLEARTNNILTDKEWDNLINRWLDENKFLREERNYYYKHIIYLKNRHKTKFDISLDIFLMEGVEKRQTIETTLRTFIEALRRANKTSFSISGKYVALMLNKSKKGVYKAIDKLIDKKIIEVTYKGNSIHGKSSTYKIL